MNLQPLKPLTIMIGDCLQVLQRLPDRSVHCCVTSPPYWGLRDYKHRAQIGLENTPQEFVDRLIKVFREVRRVLRDDGTLWVIVGDSYTGRAGGAQGCNGQVANRTAAKLNIRKQVNSKIVEGLKRKNLIGIPWRVAFGLQTDGWYLREDIIWSKPNPMVESVKDRCTRSHEHIFHLSKREHYLHDPEAMKEKGVIPAGTLAAKGSPQRSNAQHVNSRPPEYRTYDGFRNRRSVWTVKTQPYPEAHFATYPPQLIKPCILASCPVGGTVLDPFAGTGTTGLVALEFGRKAILIELNPAYADMAKRRCNVTPGLPLTSPKPPTQGPQ